MAVASIGISKKADAEEAVASWYGSESGNLTASGDVFEPHEFTCAHNSYPFGTRLGITYYGNYAECVVTDTGGFGAFGRGVDLARGVADFIGLTYAGVDVVDMQVVGFDPHWYYGKEY